MAAFFTIIVVSYNPGEKLLATLESVFSQDDGDFSVIVKDAGSTDGSVTRARAAFPDGRITWIVAPDGGIYDGMNQAIAAACDRGLAEEGLVFFLNCGDLLYDSGVLGRVRAFAEADRRACAEGEPKTIRYGDIVERRTGQRVAANPQMDAFACFRNVPNHQACFYDAALMRGERFDTHWRVRADYEHFLRCFFKKGARLKAMGFVVCDYEGGGFSESDEGRKISRAEHREITGLYFTRAQRFFYRLYLALTLQPLRRKLAESRLTSGLYHRVRGALLSERARRTS